MFDPGRAESVHAADFDGDGDMDIAAFGGPEIKIYLNDGNDHFSYHTTIIPNIKAGSWASASTFFHSASADFNNDGWVDLIFAGIDVDNNRAFFIVNGTGNGNFATSTSFAVGYSDRAIRHIASADFNGDGYLDIVLNRPGESTGDTDYLKLFLNDGTGGFTTGADIDSGIDKDYQIVISSDFNNDGYMDLVYKGK